MKLNLGKPELGATTNIRDIEIPKEMEQPLDLGHPQMNKLLEGNGIIAGTAVLVTGDPGAGKSTLMTTLGDRLTSVGHIAIYISGEESIFQ